MSRKGPAKKREILPDPKYRDDTVAKFINSLQSAGKKSTAEHIFYGALDSVETKTQEAGLDTVEANLELGFPADAREWGIGNQILADLGLTTIRILTNNPRKLTGLDGYGLKVVEQVPIEVEPQPENARYLAAKRDKLGHRITRLHHQGTRLAPETPTEETQ